MLFIKIYLSIYQYIYILADVYDIANVLNNILSRIFWYILIYCSHVNITSY